MGDIIVDMSNKVIPAMVSVERRVDNIETQMLHFTLDGDAWLRTETGNSIGIFGRDKNGNTIEVELPISIHDLKEALKDKRFQQY